MYRYKHSCIILMMTFFSCGKSGSDAAPSAPEPFESMNISLTGGASVIALTAEAPALCSVEMPFGTTESAMCITPLEVSGWIAGVRLIKENSAADDETKYYLQGEGIGLNDSGAWEGKAFDFADTTSIRGYSNLEENFEAKVTFDKISFDMTYIRFKGVINTQYWNIIIPFYSQPVEQNEIVQSCQYDEAELLKIGTNANLLAGIEFERGDILFCIKSVNSDCKLSEFNFFDTTANEFTATRPNAPRQSAMIADQDTSCVPALDANDQEQLQWGTYSFISRLSGNTPFSLYGDYAYGALSKGNPTGDVATDGSGAAIPPYKNYWHVFQDQTQTGNDMNITLNLETRNLLFLKDIDDAEELAGATDADIANGITFQNLLQSEQDPSGTDIVEAMTSEVSVTLLQKLPSSLSRE